MSEKIKELLASVARELWLTPGIDSETEAEWIPLVSSALERRLLPLLEAGQAMRNAYPTVTQFDVNAWDAALAAAKERQP